MSFREALDELRARLRNGLADADRELVSEAIARLEMLQLAELGPQPGDYLPDFTLLDAGGREVGSDEILGQGPLVLAFYRGGWCPYCDLMLRALDRHSQDIAAAGADVICVSPEKPSELCRTAERLGIGLPLFTDPEGRLARLCGVLFEMPPDLVDFYRRFFRIDLAEHHAGLGWWLPLPAAYVVRPDGCVAYAFAEHDWSRQPDPADLLAAVHRLAGQAPTPPSA